jgi:hypothetical protein
MNTKINELILLLSIVVVLSTIMLAIFILFKVRSKRHSTTFFSAYLICFCVGIAEPVHSLLFGPPVRLILSSYTFLLGPTLYWYCKEKINPGSGRWIDFLHLTPFILYLGDTIFQWTENLSVDILIFEAFLVHGIIYGLLSWKIASQTQSSLSTGYISSFAVAAIRHLGTSSILIFLALGGLTNYILIVGTELTALHLNIIQLILISHVLLAILISPEFFGDSINRLKNA